MSKFIDADGLRAELEKRLKNVHDYMNGAGMKYKGPKYFKAQGKESAYDALLNIIDSLQQEQPVTATGKVFTNTDPMNLYVERDQWAALLSQFKNGQRVRIILVKEDAE